jgi:hypothetical protein
VTLTDLESLVADAVAHDWTLDELAVGLLLRGLRADETVLADAMALQGALVGLLDGTADPYRFMECSPRAGVNVRDAAVQACETDLHWCLRSLLRGSRVTA